LSSKTKLNTRNKLKVALIGTNGFLSSYIGKYFNAQGHELLCFGLDKPSNHKYYKFHKIDLLSNNIPIEKILQSNLIIYAAGAGVQSNRKDKASIIYDVNTFIPINIIRQLE
jgi:hypothetical protein